MQVAITGGTGFVGSHTVAHLLAHGHHARLLVRDAAKAERVLASVGVDPAEVVLVVGDMADEAAVSRLLDGADAVIHAAAAIGVTGPRPSITSMTLRAARLHIAVRVSRVALPRCGIRNAFSNLSRPGCTTGSSS